MMDLPLLTLTGMQPSDITSQNLGPTASGCLQPSDSAVMQNKHLWKEEHATKLANKLARYSYFGDKVWMRSTLTGKEGVALDEKKMRAILQDVRRVACYSTTQTEFDARIRPKIRESIVSKAEES
jgi:hypothetical protein